MSFGFSPSDLVTLISLITKSYKGWRDACGEYTDITTSLQQLLNLIRQVEDQVAKELGEIISEYRALGPGRSREKNWNDLEKNWKHFRSGVKDLSGLRSRLQQNVNMISAHLTATGVNALSRIELDIKALPDQMQNAIDGLAAEIRAGRREGSAMTTYDDDEKDVWRQFRKELVGEGLKSSVIHRFKPRIKAYLRSLAEEGLLEEEEPVVEQNEQDASENQTDHGKEHAVSATHDEAIEVGSHLCGLAEGFDLDPLTQEEGTHFTSGLQATCTTDDENESGHEEIGSSVSAHSTIVRIASSDYFKRSGASEQNNDGVRHKTSQLPLEASSNDHIATDISHSDGDEHKKSQPDTSEGEAIPGPDDTQRSLSDAVWDHEVIWNSNRTDQRSQQTIRPQSSRSQIRLSMYSAMNSGHGLSGQQVETPPFTTAKSSGLRPHELDEGLAILATETGFQVPTRTNPDPIEYSYGRQYTDDMEYPIPDGYKTENDFSRIEFGPNKYSYGPWYAVDTEYPIPDGYRTEVREFYDQELSSRPGFVRKGGPNPSPGKHAHERRDAAERREKKWNSRPSLSRQATRRPSPVRALRDSPDVGESGEEIRSSRPTVFRVAARRPSLVRAPGPGDITYRKGSYGFKRGTGERPSMSRAGTGNLVFGSARA